MTSCQRSPRRERSQMRRRFPVCRNGLTVKNRTDKNRALVGLAGAVCRDLGQEYLVFNHRTSSVSLGLVSFPVT